MKTPEEIQRRIQEILADPRISYPAANIGINAPLALIQLSLETELHTLQDVLGVEKTSFRELRNK